MHESGGWEFNFYLLPEDPEDGRESRKDDAALDRIAEAFLDAVEKEGLMAGGSYGGPPTPEEKVCKKCDGIGRADPIPEERICPTCDGTGEVEPDAMSKEEWEETYGEAPVAQKDRAAVS